MLRLPLLALSLVLAVSFGPVRAADLHGVSPDRIWVAPLEEGRTLEDAWAAGAEVRDLLPEALVIADPASVRVLQDAGFQVRGPFAVPPGQTVTLVRPLEPEPAAGAMDAAAVEAAPGVSVLWTDGVGAIVASEGVLPPHDAVRDLGKKVLDAEMVLRPRPLGRDTAGRSTLFAPVIGAIVAQIDSAAYFPWIRRLAGAEEIHVGTDDLTLSTRYTMAAQCETAEQYVHERFVAMGYTDVAYHPFPIQSTTARNVIATLPGTATPEQIYILCGHLDSTSPNPYTSAPGANDNASGAAAVLTAAEILKDYSFRSTIRFVVFTGEEQGLVGSAAYAADAAALEEQILGVVNCDMIAFWEENRRVILQSQVWTGLVPLLDDACTAYTNLETDLRYFNWGSDHVSFLQRGFPALLAIESDYGRYSCYHRECDTADQNLGTFGAEVTSACVAAICHLAGVQSAVSAPVTATAHSGLVLDAHPNPFVGRTVLHFALDRAAEAEVTVHDVTGRRVRTLALGRLPAGRHERTWDGTGGLGHPLPAGVYFIRLHAGSVSVSERVVRLP